MPGDRDVVFHDASGTSPGHNDILGPPETVEPSSIYKLYRGASGEARGENLHVWVEFPALQLCWAHHDTPPMAQDHTSLLSIVSCKWQGVPDAHSPTPVRVEIFSKQQGDASPGSGGPNQTTQVAEAQSVLAVTATALGGKSLLEFAKALNLLIASRDSEGEKGLVFIQKRLFQYLWRHQGNSFSEEALYEAQAVLAFNLMPREGVSYLREKLGKQSDIEVGKWLAQMAAVKGGLDPTMLGEYFSRRDTLEVFKAFVRCLDFTDKDMVGALRLLFDTFKPGGEGQVITRILEMFAEAYFQQWSAHRDTILPKTDYEKSDDVEQVAVSLIMLNTGLHVAPKKNAGKRIVGAIMTVEEYITNTRRVVGPQQVPEEALRDWYEAVRQAEISVEPMPRAAFSELPVQPDIEGWLLLVISAQVHKRYWAVLALQRLYLFSDANEVKPAETIDLKEARACGISAEKTAKERWNRELHSNKPKCLCFVQKSRAELLDVDKAFEITQANANRPAFALLDLFTKPRTRLALVAESEDLMEKWVSLISSGPY
mmetsp:Transcript_96697/g.211446  ORF Transcript_96697/g.211446 Transcript_96697/m.211446 type:complete len:542 (+) Transcript_96697:172-1797(+)